MKEDLRNFMTENGLSQRQVADQLAISASVVNQYLKGDYSGNIHALEASIVALIARKREKVLDKKYFKFVATPNAKKALDVIRYAHIEGDIALITGEAGLGKTQALSHYAAQNPDVIFIETEPSFTAKVLLKELCKKLGLDESGNMHAMTDLIIVKLKNAERLIMIDEAELLPYRALETLRRIHDKTSVGVVLAGMPRLIMNLKGKRGEFVQLYSRVGFGYVMALAETDINALAEAVLGTDQFNKILYKAADGNARRLNKILRGVIRTAQINQCEISTDLITQFSNMLIRK